jgi:hypothetical protein
MCITEYLHLNRHAVFDSTLVCFLCCAAYLNTVYDSTSFALRKHQPADSAKPKVELSTGWEGKAVDPANSKYVCHSTVRAQRFYAYHEAFVDMKVVRLGRKNPAEISDAIFESISYGWFRIKVSLSSLPWHACAWTCDLQRNAFLTYVAQYIFGTAWRLNASTES